jgi:anti-sigma factor RsiW
MNHKPYLDWMNAALDGDLASVQRRELVEHLTACASCQATWDVLNDVQRQLKAEPLAAPRPGFAGRFRARQLARRSRTRLVWGGLVLGLSSLSVMALLAVVGVLSLNTVFSAAQVAQQPAALAALYSSGAAVLTYGSTVARAVWTVFDLLAEKALFHPVTWLLSLMALAVVISWGYLIYKLNPEVVLQ